MNVLERIECGRADMEDARRVSRLAADAAAVLSLPDEAWQSAPEGPALRARLARALSVVLEDRWGEG